MPRTSALISTATAVLLASATTGASQTPDPLYRLMQHASPGVSLVDYQAAQSMGYQAWLAQQLSEQGLNDVEAEVQSTWPTTTMTPFEMYANYGPNGMLGDDIVPRQSLRFAAIHRAISSEKRLRERIVGFWTDHFNVDHEQGEGPWLVSSFHRDVLRPHALGMFRDLAHAVAKSGAMLEYLNNDVSVAAGPNENYARELMELHMLGTEPQVYSEDDVLELAKILTGWSKKQNKLVPDYGDFKFKQANHSTGDKDLLGLTIPYDPNFPTEGETALDVLIGYRPAPSEPRTCPQFLARKLASHLLVPDPPDSIVDAAAAAFGPDGDIPAMISALLDQANWSHPDVQAQRSYMRPGKYVVSLVRALQITVPATHVRLIDEWYRKLGMELHHYPPPSGYPDSVFAWGGDQPGRWVFAWTITHDGIIGLHPDPDALFAQVGGLDLNNAGQQVSQILAAGNLSTNDVAVIQQFALMPKPIGYTSTDLKQDLLFLGAVSPSFSQY